MHAKRQKADIQQHQRVLGLSAASAAAAAAAASAAAADASS